MMQPSSSNIIQISEKENVPKIQLGNGTALAKLKTLGGMDIHPLIALSLLV